MHLSFNGCQYEYILTLVVVFLRNLFGIKYLKAQIGRVAQTKSHKLVHI